MNTRSPVKTLASEMRHRVWIQTEIQEPDLEGGFTTGWRDVRQVWASVQPIQAKQVFQYKSVNVDATHHVKMRGYVDITEKQRLIFDGRVLEILTIENIGEIDFIKFITCREQR